MSKWKYATLSEDEKIKRIGEGDKDLYESEIKNARAYQSLLKDNGVDTARADRYITRLNEAAKIPTFGTASSSDTKSKDDEKPKYLQGEKNDSMLYILDELEKAYNSYTSKRESLKEEAGKARGAVLEKLHADGYSADGEKGKKALEEVSEHYDTLLKELDEKYLPGIEKAKKVLGIFSKNTL